MGLSGAGGAEPIRSEPLLPRKFKLKISLTDVQFREIEGEQCSQRPLTRAGARGSKVKIASKQVDSRIAGLELRSKPTGVRWSMRSRLRGRQKRYDLGPAVAGDADLGGVCLNGARAQAIRVAKLTSDGQNPETFLAALETQLRVEAARPTL